MSKKAKVYSVTVTSDRTGRSLSHIGTLPELIQSFSYTLECGKSWEHEKGNKKINCQPKNIKSLVTNITNASNNSAANGYAGRSYNWEEVAI